MSTRRTHGRFLMAIAGAALVLAAPAIAMTRWCTPPSSLRKLRWASRPNLRITNLGDGTAPITMPVVSGLQFEIVAPNPPNRTHQRDNASLLIDRGARNAANGRNFLRFQGSRRSHSLCAASQFAARKRGSAAPVGQPPPTESSAILAGGSIPKGVRLTEDGSAYVK